jgi:hypothetical protein
MMCHKIGLPPISTIGFGRAVVSSAIRVPKPPARITTFINILRVAEAARLGSIVMLIAGFAGSTVADKHRSTTGKRVPNQA